MQINPSWWRPIASMTARRCSWPKTVFDSERAAASRPGGFPDTARGYGVRVTKFTLRRSYKVVP